jgi:hypothetical protein
VESHLHQAKVLYIFPLRLDDFAKHGGDSKEGWIHASNHRWVYRTEVIFGTYWYTQNEIAIHKIRDERNLLPIALPTVG